jgi:hypothetical protein
MRRGLIQHTGWTLMAVGSIAMAVAACGSSEESGSLGGNRTGTGGNGAGDNGTPSPNEVPKTPAEQVKEILDARKVDFGEAARTAKLKLNDELPTLEEINAIGNASGDAAKKAAYDSLVDTWIASPKFAATMVKFWRDTFRTAQVGTVQMNQPDKDKAANFAAQVVVADRPYTDLFTASTGTCPTFDPATGAFTAAACGTTPTVGVLTDPGLQAQYFSNMAFRRVRFIQETFACSKFPAEYSDKPVPMGNGTYTGKVDFKSIQGKQVNPQARVDFHDTSAVVCANCHSTMNYIAPLFLNYNANGALQATPQVDVPIAGNPKARPDDYLPAGTGLAWRSGKPVTDMASLGQAIAADPEVAQCAVNRVWNYAFSRGDIVNDLASVPVDVTKPIVAQFASNGFKLKDVVRAVFKAEDFSKF